MLDTELIMMLLLLIFLLVFWYWLLSKVPAYLLMESRNLNIVAARGSLFSATLAAIFLYLIPVGLYINTFHIILGTLIAFVVFGGLFLLKRSIWGLILSILFLSFPWWWLLSDEMMSLLYVSSIGFYVGTLLYLMFIYDFVKWSPSETRATPITKFVYIATAVSVILWSVFAPITVDRYSVFLVTLAFSFLLVWLLNTTGVSFGRFGPWTILIIVIFALWYWPNVVYDFYINSVLVGSMLAAMVGYIVKG